MGFDAVLIRFVDDVSADAGMPGDAKYFKNGGDAPAGILFRCPGCASLTFARFAPADAPSWQWDGNRDAPTLTPSLHHTATLGGCGWHGFLTAGEFKPC